MCVHTHTYTSIAHIVSDLLFKCLKTVPPAAVFKASLPPLLEQY